MAKIHADYPINAPVERVFEVFTSFEKLPEWVSGIEKMEVLTDGPIGVGSKYKETRIFFKKEAVEEFEVTEFVENVRFALLSHSCGFVYHISYDFQRTEDGTNVRFEMDTKAVKFMAKLMAPMGVFMKGMMLKCINQDFADLKNIAEAPEPEPVSV